MFFRMVNILLFQYHLLKDYSSSLNELGNPFQKSTDHKHKDLFLDSQFVPSFQVLPVIHWVDHCSFVVRFEIGKRESSNFVLLSRLLWLCRTPLYFYTTFRIMTLSSVDDFTAIGLRKVLNLSICFLIGDSD